MLRPALIALALLTTPVQAAVLNEATTGEFSDDFANPTDFSGFQTIHGQSSGREDIEYFSFASLLSNTTALHFELVNEGQSTNFQIRLSSTPFTRANWDWRAKALAPAEYLYADRWNPVDTYDWVAPDGFSGPIFGFVRFYDTRSASSFSISQVSSVAEVPLPGALALLLAGLGAFGVVRQAGVRRT